MAENHMTVRSDRTADTPSERYFQAIFEGALDAMVIADNEGTYQEVNSAACKLFGLPREELIGRHLTDFTEPGFDFNEAWQSFRQSHQDVGEFRLHRIDGTTRVVEYKATANFLPDRHLSVLRDITERQQLEAELRQKEAWFRNSVENLLDCFGIYTAIRDRSGRIVDFQIEYVNAAACKSNCMTKEEQIGKQLCTLFPLHLQSGLFERYCQVVETGVPVSEELFVAQRAIDIRLAKQGDGFVAAWRDITQRRQTEAELRQYRDRLEQLVAERTAELTQINQQLQQEIARHQQTQKALQKSQERYAMAVNAGQVGVWDWNLKTNEIYLDPPLKAMLGYADDEIYNHLDDWGKYVHPDDSAAVMAAANAHFAGETPYFEVTHRMLHKDGSIRWIFARGTALRDANGQPYRVMGTDTDISDRKWVEAELHRREQEFKAIAEHSPDIIARFDRQLRHIYVNPAIEQLAGLPRSSFLGKTNAEWGMPADLIELWHLAIQTVFDTAQAKSIEFEMLTPFGLRHYHSRLVPEFNPDGSVEFVLGVTRDLTELKQTERALKESQRFIQQVTEAIPTLLYVYDLTERRNIYANHAFVHILNYTPDELQKMGNLVFQRLMHPDDLAKVPERLPAFDTIQDGEIIETEYRMQHKNGTWRWLHSRDTIFLRSPDGAPKQVLGTAQDITERKQAEVALQESETKFRILAETATAGITIVRGKRILYANPAAIAIAGYSQAELLAMNCWELMPLPYQNLLKARPLNRYQRQTVSSKLEIKIITKTGAERWLECTRAEIEFQGKRAILATAFDITERKQAEVALQLQAERERLNNAIAQRIRHSLNLTEILATTVAEVRQLLQVDRVVIYRFYPDNSGLVVVESVGQQWKPMLGERFLNPCCLPKESCHLVVEQSQICIIEDIQTANLDPSYIDALVQFQVKAQLLVSLLSAGEAQAEHCYSIQTYQTSKPIASYVLPPGCASNPTLLNTANSWGSLVAQQCSGDRKWQPFEVALLQQLGTQVAIAIQQAELYQQLQLANQQLRQLASIDSLTGLANRRRFDEYLNQQWRHLAREQQPLSLILCDIDFFKLYNDHYGHLGGDFCLQHVSKVLLSAVKRPADLVCRYGGEEFAAILPYTTGQGALCVAESIRQAIKQLQMTHAGSNVSAYVTFSLGVASIIPCLDILPDTLIAMADTALYEAKAQGRDRSILKQI